MSFKKLLIPLPTTNLVFYGKITKMTTSAPINFETTTRKTIPKPKIPTYSPTIITPRPEPKIPTYQTTTVEIKSKISATKKSAVSVTTSTTDNLEINYLEEPLSTTNQMTTDSAEEFLKFASKFNGSKSQDKVESMNVTTTRAAEIFNIISRFDETKTKEMKNNSTVSSQNQKSKFLKYALKFNRLF